MDDPADLFACDDVSDVGSWNLIQPSPKSQPLSSPRVIHASPRIRAPFQVADLSASSKPEPVVHSQRGLMVQPGLARPTLSVHAFPASFERVSNLDDNQVGPSGLSAPQFSQQPPQSLMHDDLTAYQLESFQNDTMDVAAGEVHSVNRVPFKLGAISKQTAEGSNLTRVRLASKSPLVWKLWLQFSAALSAFSSVLQQISQSQFSVEHAERFLNQFAATTLMRYMQSILQFLRLCQDLQVDIAQLTESVLADLLVSGSLARRSDGSGPKCSITIKSLKWCCKQLGVQQFGAVFGQLIASFEKQKIPDERKESLPYPL